MIFEVFMQVSFTQDSIDNILLEYANPVSKIASGAKAATGKVTGTVGDEHDRAYRKFFDNAYKDLQKILKANNLDLEMSTDIKVLKIVPKDFVGQIVIEHSQDPRAKDLYTVVPYGIRGSKSVNDRLQDGVVLSLKDLQGNKGLAIVKKVVNNFITSNKFLNEALLEAENDIYSSTEKQKEAEEAEAQKEAEQSQDKPTAAKNTDYLKEAEKSILEHLKALKIEKGKGFQIESKSNSIKHRVTITLKAQTLIELHLKYQLDNTQAFVTKIKTTLGEEIDVDNLNIITVFNKLTKKLALNPTFNAAKYFTVGKYQEKDDEKNPEDIKDDGTDASEPGDAPEESKPGEPDAAQDSQEASEIDGKNEYQESLIKILLKNTVQEKREALQDALSKNDFSAAIMLLRDKNNRPTLTDTKVRIAFSRLILFNVCGVTKPETFDDIRALDFFASIDGFKSTIDPRMNQKLDIIRRYIIANPSAIFTASSSDQYLFTFLQEDPTQLDSFDRIVTRNPAPIATLFDLKTPKAILTPLSAIFYSRDFFKTYTRNAELVYNLWRSFNPTASQIAEFREILKITPDEIGDSAKLTNIEKLKSMLDIPPMTVKVRDLKKYSGDIQAAKDIIAQYPKKIQQLLAERDNTKILLYIKQHIFLIAGNKFRPNIAEIERGIKLFKFVCSGDTIKNNTGTSTNSAEPSSIDIADDSDDSVILNTLISASKSDQVAQGLSEMIKQLNKKLKAAESNTELSGELKAIQTALISILKK